MIVKPITKNIANSIVSNKHYSRRVGIFWEGFGLYNEDKIVGVCCFGQPSAPIQKYAFVNRDFRLYELTRLVVDRGHQNGASILISKALKMISSTPCAVISYADSHHGHCGIVYQATNWLYTGATVSHDCLYMVDGTPTHPITLRDKLGITCPAEWAKKNGIEKIKPKPKHRYFYFVGNKYQKAEMLAKLAYSKVSQYPKVEKSLYDDGDRNCAEYIEK